MAVFGLGAPRAPPHSSHNGRVRHTKSATERPSGAEPGNKLLLLMPLSLRRRPSCAADSLSGCRADGGEAEETGRTWPLPGAGSVRGVVGPQVFNPQLLFSVLQHTFVRLGASSG